MQRVAPVKEPCYGCYRTERRQLTRGVAPSGMEVLALLCCFGQPPAVFCDSGRDWRVRVVRFSSM